MLTSWIARLNLEKLNLRSPKQPSISDLVTIYFLIKQYILLAKTLKIAKSKFKSWLLVREVNRKHLLVPKTVRAMGIRASFKWHGCKYYCSCPDLFYSGPRNNGFKEYCQLPRSISWIWKENILFAISPELNQIASYHNDHGLFWGPDCSMLKEKLCEKPCYYCYTIWTERCSSTPLIPLHLQFIKYIGFIYCFEFI